MNRIPLRLHLAAALLCAAAAAPAMAAPPAAGGIAAPVPAAAPAAAPATAATPAPPVDEVHMGLTIQGDKESPLGLFITPWKNAYAPEQGEQPALLLDITAQPLDPDTFRRQVSYDRAFAEYGPPGTLP